MVNNCATCILQGSAHFSFSCLVVLLGTCLIGSAVHSTEQSSSVHQLCLRTPTATAKPTASWSAQCLAGQTGQMVVVCLLSTVSHFLCTSALLSRHHAPVQDTYLSPRQATQLHTLSSAVSLPDSDSDDEPEMPSHASAHAAGLEAAAPPQEDTGLSITEGVQSTASEGSPASADDSASSISGMSGVSSIAATEVVDDQQDASAAPRKFPGSLICPGGLVVSVYQCFQYKYAHCQKHFPLTRSMGSMFEQLGSACTSNVGTSV